MFLRKHKHPLSQQTPPSLIKGLILQFQLPASLKDLTCDITQQTNIKQTSWQLASSTSIVCVSLLVQKMCVSCSGTCHVVFFCLFSTQRAFRFVHFFLFDFWVQAWDGETVEHAQVSTVAGSHVNLAFVYNCCMKSTFKAKRIALRYERSRSVLGPSSRWATENLSSCGTGAWNREPWKWCRNLG